MRTMLAGMAVALGLAGAAWAQEGNKEKGKSEKELSIALAEVDTNGDGKASITEIRVAIAKFMPPEAKKEGDGKKRNQGEGANREGAKGKDGKGVPEASMVLVDVDTNKDKRATLKELQVALDSLLNPKKEGDAKK